MEELGIDGIDVTTPPESSVPEFNPLGKAISVQEIKDRLSANLYRQLSDGSDETTVDAVSRAQIYVGAVMRRLGQAYTLDDTTMREITLIMTVYELHIALGHEEAGRECRKKAKDIIVAAYGDYPDSDDGSSAAASSGAVAQSRQAKDGCSRYERALRIGERRVRRY